MDDAIEKLREENDDLKRQLEELRLKYNQQQKHQNTTDRIGGDGLSNDDIARYSRQLLMPEIGVSGQVAIKQSSVLIVGAGGLGAPAGLYLAAAGFGRIGIVDYDDVEINNLHRQVIHSEERVGISKALSAKMTMQSLNSNADYKTYCVLLNRHNALEILKQHDIVLDCTDNVATRYLLNDACVILNKPLVSGSALRTEGQLTTYHFPSIDANGDIQYGPCYRCLFPEPPNSNTVTNCNDGGVVGAVPGVIGCLQALEAIKVAIRLKDPQNNRMELYSQKMLLMDGSSGMFRVIKLRPRRKNCSVCGDEPTVTDLIDYEQFCGAGANDKAPSISIAKQDERITCQEYYRIRKSGKPHLLVDVREKIQYDICALPNSIHIPFVQLAERIDEITQRILGSEQEVFFLCRRGNDSQRAVQFFNGKTPFFARDIIGGLTTWAREIDPAFPIY